MACALWTEAGGIAKPLPGTPGVVEKVFPKSDGTENRKNGTSGGIRTV
jgi:hypothetical protein